MKKEEFNVRLKKAMNIKNIKPIELANKLNVNRAVISQYLSNRYKPNQNRLYDLANVLNVNPVWLMGFDVPMETSELKEIKLNDGIVLRVKPGAKINDEDIEFIRKYIDVKYGGRND